jgi:peroxiredoxin Q/BCP
MRSIHARVAAIAILAALSAIADELPAAGNRAPGFTLKSQEGKPISLADYKGKWVVLYFYPKDMTQGCTIEARNFQRDQAEYGKRNAVVLGVSADNVDSHQEFCTKESLSFKLLADPERTVIGQYGSLSPNGSMAARNTFLIDPQGVIRKVYTKVNPTPHSAEVLAALDELKQ